MGENFLLAGSDVRHRPDGRVEKIIAVFGGEKILIEVVNGQPKRRETPEIPYFAIPAERFHSFYRQIRAIIADGEKTAKRFAGLKKMDWADNLKKCGLNIGDGGKVIVPRRRTNAETGEVKVILMHAADINSAIRMQDHIRNYYDPCLSAELNELLGKFSVKRPYLELRREVLLFAKTQMQLTLGQAYDRFKRLAAMAASENRPDFTALQEKIAELSFLLTNRWANPYLNDVKTAITHLNRAKKATAREQKQTILLHLLRAKILLKKLAESARQDGERLSEIDPIKTLAEIHRLDKAKEVLAAAKRQTPGAQTFVLSDLLKISRGIIEAAKAERETEPSRTKRGEAAPAYEQGDLF